jgi:hypothetical protein
VSAQKPSLEERMADVVVEAIKMAVKPLQARIAALEARPELKYGGVFEQGAAYREGTLVTRSGSLWLALRETRAAPGSDPEKWRLVVKSGGA